MNFVIKLSKENEPVHVTSGFLSFFDKETKQKGMHKILGKYRQTKVSRAKKRASSAFLDKAVVSPIYAEF